MLIKYNANYDIFNLLEPHKLKYTQKHLIYACKHRNISIVKYLIEKQGLKANEIMFKTAYFTNIPQNIFIF